jgi:voltage-gated potassium channel
MALGSGYSKRNQVARETALFGAFLTLVGVVGVSVAGGVNFLFLAIVSSATVATAVIRMLFPHRCFFSHTFTSLVAVYASIFALFVEELFGQIEPTTAGIGFCVPILAFLFGCWLRRAGIRAVIDHPDIRDGEALYRALAWLVPVFLVGGVVFSLSWLSEAMVNTNLVFLLAMSAIGLIVLGVSRSVAIFLVDAGLLFEEFFQRMSRLAIPAFAFLTFYALLVIIFASIFSIVSQFSTGDHFRVGSLTRALSFSEAMHFSIVTISTVGYGDIVPASNIARVLTSIEVICGVLLLMFGVSELLEYTREHRRDRPNVVEQVEGPHAETATAMKVQRVKVRQAVRVARHELTVDDAGAHARPALKGIDHTTDWA